MSLDSIYKQALKDFNNARKLFNGLTFKECINKIDKKDLVKVCAGLFIDVNYGACCLSISFGGNDNRAKVANSVAIYDDNKNSYLGIFTLEQLEELGG